VHFQAESDPFRRKFLAVICELQISARIYVAGGRSDLSARRAILTRLVGDAVAMGAERLVLERDDSTRVHDERIIKAERSRLRAADSFRFDHLRSTEDPLLWIPAQVG
jgi:hypothetical protein